MKIRTILNRPHPFIFNKYSVLLPSIITFLLLVIFKPFEFNTFSNSQLLLWSLLFASLAGAAVYCNVVIVKKTARKNLIDNWTIKNEVLLVLSVLFSISLIIYVLFLKLITDPDRFELFRLVVFRTLSISFFPVLVLVLYEQTVHQRIKTKQAEQLNRELLKKQNTAEANTHDMAFNQKIVLQAENEKVAIQLKPMDLLFIKSDGNYVEVFYNKNQSVQKELIRNSLKAIEENISSKDFFRCHNRFLINIHHIQKVEGNARNLELSVMNVDEKIPVSRSKSEKLLEFFERTS